MKGTFRFFQWMLFASVMLIMSSAFAQSKELDVRFANESADCDAGRLFVEVQFRNTTGTEYLLAGATLRFKYDASILGDAVLHEQIAEASSVTVRFNNSTWSYGWTNPVSSGPSDTIPASGEWVTAGILSFPILQYDECVVLDWSVCDDNDFPCTYASEYLVVNGSPTTQPFNMEQHLNHEICLDGICNLPPNVTHPSDPNDTDTVSSTVNIGQNLTECFDIVNDPSDNATDNSVCTPLQQTNPAAGNVFISTNTANEVCLTYTPTATAQAADTVKLVVCDVGFCIPGTSCDTLVWALNILPDNFPPDAVDDIVSTPQGTSIDVSVLDNDTDEGVPIDPNNATVTQIINGQDCPDVDPNTQGTLTLSNGIFTFNPLPTFVGQVMFCYELCDEDGLCDQAIVFIEVTSPCSENFAVSVSTINPSFTGGNDGSASANVTGGTGPFNFAWNNGVGGTSSLNALSAGSYCVTVTDQSTGCTVEDCGSVVDPPCGADLQISNIVSSPVKCFGGNDGSAQIVAETNSNFEPIAYLWADGTTDNTRTGLDAGVYSVTVRDIRGEVCQITQSVQVFQPQPINISIDHQDATGGLDNGEASANVTGGTMPYSYAWKRLSNSQIVSMNEEALGLVGCEEYRVIVTDLRNCIDSSKVFIDCGACADALDLFPRSSNVTCNGFDNGSAIALISGATGNVTYSWSNGATTQVISDLSPGNYEINVEDEAGCRASGSVIVTEPQAITGSFSGTDVSCFGEENGDLNLSVAGGRQPYTYLWSNGETDQDVGMLGVGAYSVTIRDGNGCLGTGTSTVQGPTSAMSVLIQKTNESATGAEDGTATAEASNGFVPYTYEWSTGAITQTISNLPPGTYTVTATDLKGCMAIQSTVIQPFACSDLSLSMSSEPVSCNGDMDGAATVIPSGGVPGYSYLWSTGATGNSISNIGAGLYGVTVTDNKQCKQAATVEVMDRAKLVIQIAKSDASGPAALDGWAQATVFGGVQPYSYQWSNFDITAVSENLSPGQYSVVVTDDNNCVVTGIVQINEPGSNGLSAGISTRNIDCANDNDGRANVVVQGGTSPYSYAWSTQESTPSINDLSVGTYCVTVTDANGFKAIACGEVSGPEQLTLLAAKNDILCAGENNGSIDLSASGGVPPYTYQWTPSGNTDQDEVNIPAGTHTVVVRDANNCSAELTVIITEPTDPLAIILIQKDDESAPDLCDGALEVVGSSGTSPYTYAWSNSELTARIENLCDGIYTVTVTDANGCEVVETYQIIGGECSFTEVRILEFDVQCNGDADGELVANPIGEPPFTYNWSNGENTQNISGLSGGDYSVTVTQVNSDCEVIATGTVEEPDAPLSAFIDVTDVTCFEANDGEIGITPFGGTPPITIMWNHGPTSFAINNLEGDKDYFFTLEDANGCQTGNGAYVPQPERILVQVTPTEISAAGLCDGAASTSVTGGTGVYSYQWDNGAGNATTADISNLCAGTYFVTVTDQNGCTGIGEVTISDIDCSGFTTVLIDVVDVTCNGDANGSLSARAVNGQAPYSFEWENGPTTADYTNVMGGDYVVSVMDANGCGPVIASAMVFEPEVLNITPNESDVQCTGDNDGFINLIVQGGNGNYSYVWGDGPVTQNRNNLSAGTYTVTVKDEENCEANASITINEPSAALSATVLSTDVDCFGNNTGSAQVTPVGGTAPYEFYWRDGSINQNRTGLFAGTYVVDIYDANGCLFTSVVTIDEPNALVIDIEGNRPSTVGGNDGSAKATPSGGTPGYTYLWNTNPIQTTQTATGLSTGNYTVTVRDANGCERVSNITISDVDCSQFSSVIVLAQENVSCNGTCDGEVELLPNGGSAPYNYAWPSMPVDQSALEQNLCAGSYEVTVTDDSGCVRSVNITITQPAVLEASVAEKANVDCFGDNNGFIDVAVAGGTAPYTFAWNDGEASEDRFLLSAGNYSVTITDANGCDFELNNINVTEPSQLSIAGSVTQEISCNDACDGELTATAAGGTTPYQYMWNTNFAGAVLSNVCDGNYFVTVTDDNGCTANVQVDIDEPTELEVSVNVNHISAVGECDGSASAIVTGGTSPYTYNWNGTSTGPVNNRTGLCAGVNTLVVTDARGCTFTMSFVVQSPNCAANFQDLSIVVVNEVSCFEGSNGSLRAQPEDGTAPFAYSWSNFAATQTISNLSSGFYEVTVTDDENCQQIANVTLDNPSELIVNAGVNTAVCEGEEVVLGGSPTASGGTGTLGYSWTPNGSTQSNPTVTVSATTTYVVVVSDSEGCIEQDEITVAALEKPSISAVTTNNVSTCGGSDGSIDLSGLTAGQSYTINYNKDNAPQPALFAVANAQGVISITNLTEGTVSSILVTASNGNCVSDPISGGPFVIECDTPPNTAPIARDDINVTVQGVAVNGNALFNDFDLENNNLTPALVTTPDNGSVMLFPNGVYRYVPNPGFIGTDVFTYSICDDGVPVMCDEATVTIEVLPEDRGTDNNPPTAVNEDYFFFSGDVYAGNWISNDFDIDNDNFSLKSIVVQGSNGTFTLGNNGLFQYSPSNASFLGQDQAVYQICDNGSPELCDEATITIHIITDTAYGDKKPPIAVDDANEGDINQDQAGNVRENDRHPDGETLRVIPFPISAPSNGEIVMDEQGNYTYTPDANYVGPDQFTYSICTITDFPPICSEATVYLVVLPEEPIENNPPLARDDIGVVDEDGQLLSTVITNDKDPEGDNLTVNTDPIDGPNNGTVILSPNGTYLYRPFPGFVGEDQFTYEVCDNGTPEMCDVATVYIEVLPNEIGPENHAPTGNVDDVIAYQNEVITINVLANDFDIDSGDVITARPTLVFPPVSGSVLTIQPNGTVIYQPNTDFVGEDRFAYRVCDNGTPELCDITWVTVHILPDTADNNPPVAVDDSYTGQKGDVVSGDVTDNDYDLDGPGNLVVQPFLIDGPTSGQVDINPDGTFDYTPDPDFTGTDQFVYQVCEFNLGVVGKCTEATAFIHITPNKNDENDAPIAINDILNAVQDEPATGNVLTNDSDPDGDELCVELENSPEHGRVTMFSNGNYIYEPETGYVGEDEFTYEVCECEDNQPRLCDEATVYIEVLPLELDPENNAPIANPDHFITYVGETIFNVSVTANDFDKDSLDMFEVEVLFFGAQNGQLTVSDEGDMIYIPNDGFVGDDQFIYEICDQNGACDRAIVVIEVLPKEGVGEDLPPVAIDDANSGTKDKPVSGNVIDNDYDLDNEDLTVNEDPVKDPSNGDVILNDDGTYTYIPEPGFVGADFFIYEVCDEATPVKCDEATVYLTITEAADPVTGDGFLPRADINITVENTPVSGDVSTNDRLPEGIEVSYQLVGNPSSGGIVGLDPETGEYTYQPPTGFTGEDNFFYQVCLETTPRECKVVPVYIEVLPNDPIGNNEPPVGNADDAVTERSTPVVINVLANDFDPNGDPLTIKPVEGSRPSNGTIIVNPETGEITYSPFPGFEGDDEFEYEVCDNANPENCDIVKVEVHVLPENETGENTPPVAIDDAAFGPMNQTIRESLIANDYDLDGDAITAGSFTVVDPQNGSVFIDPSSGTYNYSPRPGFSGTDQFVYTICDNGSPQECDTATVFITILPVAPCVDTEVEHIDCAGVNDGAIRLMITCGTAPFTYTWSDGGTTTRDRSGLPAGSYTVTVTDQFGTSTVVENIEIEGANEIMVTASTLNPSCAGDVDGSISLSISGGTGVYTVEWSDNGTGTERTGLSAGEYIARITDENGCSVEFKYSLTPESSITVQWSVVKSTCGEEDGSINITPLGGSGNYSYDWDGPSNFDASTEDINNVGAGVYVVEVTDDITNCLVTETIPLSDNVDFEVTATVQNTSSCGAVDGLISLNVPNGRNFQFEWSSGCGDERICSGLAAGEYCVTVTDLDNECQFVACYTINETNSLVASFSSDNPSCGSSDGFVSVSISGGSGNYSYRWSHDAQQTSPVISGLVAGIYTTTVTDNITGCELVATIELSNEGSILDLEVQHATCSGASDGAISILNTSNSFEYLWSTGAETSSIDNLKPGDYSVEVTDFTNGCNYFGTATITEPMPINATATIINESCQGAGNGGIELDIMGGTLPYAFAWADGEASSEDRSSLTSGDYSVVITDANGCEGALSASVGIDPDGLQVEIVEVQGVQCSDFIPSGSFKLEASGGEAPYKFTMNGQEVLSDSVFDAFMLDAGVYTVFIEDAESNCISKVEIVIDRFNGREIESTVVNETCVGSQDGSITVEVSPNDNLRYEWSTGEFTPTIENLGVGNYTVNIYDEESECSVTKAYTISSNGGDFGINAVIRNANCSAAAGDGTIEITIGGGSGDFSYSWSGPNGFTSSDNNLSGLSPGNYTIAVTDANDNCVVEESFAVNHTQGPEVVATVEAAICDNANGAVRLDVAENATYMWSNETTGKDLEGVVAGEYAVTVTNSEGCATVLNVEVGQTPGFDIDASITNATCQLTNGSIELTVSNGSGAYSYAWSNGESGASLSDVAGGVYQVTVTDLNTGCSDEAIFTVSEHEDVNTSTIEADDISSVACAGGMDGFINVTVNGPDERYTYEWSNGALTEDVAGLSAGKYILEVTTKNNLCKVYATYDITEPQAMTVHADVVDCEDDAANGSITATVSGGTPKYSFSWSNGQNGAMNENLGSGSYTLTVQDGNGCSLVGDFDVSCSEGEPGEELDIIQIVTPDGDGNDDTWIINNIEMYPNNTVKVFNRWGDIVYETQGYSNNNGWAGIFKNTTNLVPDGTYYYVIELDDEKAPVKDYSGFLMLIRL